MHSEACSVVLSGEVAEWPKALVSKTSMAERSSWVRLPPSPLEVRPTDSETQFQRYDMKKATPRKKYGDVPAVFRFKARLFKHPQSAKSSSWMLLDVPKRVSKKFSLRGMATVEGTMNRHPFRAALESNVSRSHSLRVNRAMLRGARAEVGDTVELAILAPEPEPTIPSDLRVVLTASREATALWRNLTTLGRLDWIRWINSAKTPETRSRRITRTVEQLSSGKRRACCVNVYEYMLCRIDENRADRKV